MRHRVAAMTVVAAATFAAGVLTIRAADALADAELQRGEYESLWSGNITFRDAAEPDPLASIARDLDRAAQLRQNGQPGHGDLIRRSAARLARLGMHEDAFQVLDRVLESPESNFNLAEAYRMQGQYAQSLNRHRLAERAFARQLQVYDANPEMRAQFSSSYRSGVSQYLLLLERRGDIAGAIRANDRILEHPTIFGSAAVASALVSKARLLRKIGDDEGQLETIDRLLADYADDIRGGDLSVARLRLTRAEMLDPSKSAPEYVALLWELWNDPRLAGELWVVTTVVQRLGDVLKTQGEWEEWFDLTAQALDRIDAIRQRAEAAGIDMSFSRKRRISEAEETLLSSLQSAANFNRPDLTLTALDRLEAAARNEQERNDFQQQRDRLLGRLFDDHEQIPAGDGRSRMGPAEFMASWAAGDTNADYNNDGKIDSNDLLLFLFDWMDCNN